MALKVVQKSLTNREHVHISNCFSLHIMKVSVYSITLNRKLANEIGFFLCNITRFSVFHLVEKQVRETRYGENELSDY